MKRLTKKEVSSDANMYPVYSKLSKLEDIEEELGIDLGRLLKLLSRLLEFDESDRLYCKFKDRILVGYFISALTLKKLDIGVKGAEINSVFDYDSLTFGLSDYGKTWAFTKEELEND
jgi:hypothetical protein